MGSIFARKSSSICSKVAASPSKVMLSSRSFSRARCKNWCRRARTASFQSLKKWVALCSSTKNLRKCKKLYWTLTWRNSLMIRLSGKSRPNFRVLSSKKKHSKRSKSSKWRNVHTSASCTSKRSRLRINRSINFARRNRFSWWSARKS